MYEFRLRFHWNLFPKFELTTFYDWFRKWLGADQTTSHYLNQWMMVDFLTHIYALLGLSDLTREDKPNDNKETNGLPTSFQSGRVHYSGVIMGAMASQITSFATCCPAARLPSVPSDSRCEDRRRVSRSGTAADSGGQDGFAIVYSTIYSGVDRRKHQSSASLAFVREIHRWPVNSPHKGPVMRKMFPFDDVTMWLKWQNSMSTGTPYLLMLVHK